MNYPERQDPDFDDFFANMREDIETIRAQDPWDIGQAAVAISYQIGYHSRMIRKLSSQLKDLFL